VVEVLADHATVAADDGTMLPCRFRGRLRQSGDQVLAGDRVTVRVEEPWSVIERIWPRHNQLVRPPVANVTGLGVVYSPVAPVGSLVMLDRRLVTAELLGLAALIVVTKQDLWPDRSTVWHTLAAWRRLYPTVAVSLVAETGLAELAAQVANGVWVLTGESGVGKTSLLMRLIPDVRRTVGPLSTRTGRGRQTTRAVSLSRFGEGWLADTPGFTQLELPPHDARALRDAFPEWRGVRCRYADCLHRGDAGCVVPDMIAAGDVDRRRYAHYRLFLGEPPPARHRSGGGDRRPSLQDA